MEPTWLWGYLLPIGFLLLAWGGLAPHKARQTTPLVALAMALSVLGYWAVGYALHLGGAHAIMPDNAELAGLDMLLAPAGWGIMGLKGFAFTGTALTETAISLFLTYLPLIISATVLSVLALANARRWLMVLAGALMGTVIFPIAACWAWGGGWLATLGFNLELAHGFVDFGGSGLTLWLPASMVTGILLFQERQPVETLPTVPPAYFPLLANLGAMLVGIGWLGWALSTPFHTYGATLNWHHTALNILLGMAGAVLTSQLYAWLVTGEPEPLMAARGLAAGWGAALAGAPFLSPWAALITGLLAGILFPLALYAVENSLRLGDTSATLTLGLAGGFWGLISTALFANGQWGQGWNGIESTGPAGIAGLFAGGSKQLVAQLVGILALGMWGLLWGVILGLIAKPRPRLSLLSHEDDAMGDTHEEIEDLTLSEELEPVMTEAAPDKDDHNDEGD